MSGYARSASVQSSLAPGTIYLVRSWRLIFSGAGTRAGKALLYMLITSVEANHRIRNDDILGVLELVD